MTTRLDGLRVLVTGGSRGLGQAMVETFTRLGATVAFTYSRDEEGARATIERSRQAGRVAEGHLVSVLDAPATAALVRSLEERWGAIDALVNNSCILQTLPLALIEEEDFDRVMAVNVKGTFLTSKAVLRGMIRRRAGTILNLGSIAAQRMVGAPVHYAASKAAVEGLTRALAAEVGRYGIRVNCLAPGMLDGGISASLPAHRRQDYVDHCGLRRGGTLEEVAKLAAFLISPASGYVSGETILADGCL